MKLTVDLPSDHPMHALAPTAVQARRLLEFRLAELSSDLNVPRLNAQFRGADRYGLRLDDEPLRTRWRAASHVTASTPVSPTAPPGLVDAEGACATVLDDLLAQRQRLRVEQTRLFLPALPTLTLTVASIDELESPFDGRPRSQIERQFHEGLFPSTGLLLPALTVAADAELAPGQFRVALNGVRLPPQFGPCSDSLFVDDSPDRVASLIPAARVWPSAHPGTGRLSALVPATEDVFLACEAAGLPTIGPWAYRMAAVHGAIRHQGADFLGDDAVALMRQRTELAFPQLAQAARRFDDTQLGEVLRALADEGVSVRNLWSILRSMTGLRALSNVDTTDDRIVFGPADDGLGFGVAAERSDGFSTTELLIAARIGLRSALLHQQTQGALAPPVLLLSQAIERAFVRGATEEEHLALRHALGRKVDEMPPGARLPMLLAAATARRAVWEALHIEFPDVAVLAFQEIEPAIDVKFIGRIEWDHNTGAAA